MIINKVTKVFGSVLTEEQLQLHLDENNSDGWYLVGVDNLVGWYRFFWAKEIE